MTKNNNLIFGIFQRNDPKVKKLLENSLPIKKITFYIENKPPKTLVQLRNKNYVSLDFINEISNSFEGKFMNCALNMKIQNEEVEFNPVKKIIFYNKTIKNQNLKRKFEEFPKEWIELKNEKYFEFSQIKEIANNAQGKFLESLLLNVPKERIELFETNFYKPQDRREGFNYIDGRGYLVNEQKVLELNFENKTLNSKRKF